MGHGKGGSGGVCVPGLAIFVGVESGFETRDGGWAFFDDLVAPSDGFGFELGERHDVVDELG